MARIGTAFVEIKPDLSAFGAGLRPKIEAEVKAATAGLGGDIRKTVKVDVDRSSLGRVGSTISTALRGATAAIGGLLGNLPVIGGLFEGLTSAMGTSALGASGAAVAIAGLGVVLVALAASLASAVLGLGALAVALGAALGPALIVTIGAFTRFAEIIKAVKDHEQNAGTEARGLAGAHQQLQAATDAVAQAQGNLKDQTTAAYQAWQDSIENVKDDLLGVQHATLGIADANLSLREAQQALRDFKREGATGLDAVFKKFTNVNVDFSGLKDALSKVHDARGKALSGDDELKLERLILNIREAKLREKDATDGLHDSNVKLKADRKTEAGFIRDGIAAYKPYTAATRQLAGAERSLASARRGLAGATARQAKAWKDLSPMEKTFGQTLIKLGDTLKKVFEPVMNALLPGVTKGLQIFADFATDPKIKSALVETGKALGGAFAQFATLLTTPEMRDLFKRFSDAGVKIIPDLVDAFGNLFTVLARIAGVAVGKDGLQGVIAGFDDWTKKILGATSNTKELHKHVKEVIGSFKTWVDRIGDVITALYHIGDWVNRHKKLIEGLAALWVAYKAAAILALTATRLQLIAQFSGLGSRAAAAGSIAGGRFGRAFRALGWIALGAFIGDKILAGASKILAGTSLLDALGGAGVADASDPIVNKARAQGRHLAAHPSILRQFFAAHPGDKALNDALTRISAGPLRHGKAGKEQDAIEQSLINRLIRDGFPGFVPGAPGIPKDYRPGHPYRGHLPHVRSPYHSPAHAPSGRTFRDAAVTNQNNYITITTAEAAIPDGRLAGAQLLRTIAALP